RGIAATEFALVLPVMILMLFGATEVSKLITVDRKTTVATATLADLSSQNEVVTCKELAGVGAVTRQVYEPYSGNDAVLTIGHIVIRNNAAVVEWSKRLVTDDTTTPATLRCEDVPATSWLARGKPIVIDKGIFAAGGGVVVSEVSLPYEAMGPFFIGRGMNSTDKYFLRPRKSLKLKLCLDTDPNATPSSCQTTT
ncbi:MAG: hypothetical protein RL186_1469, partial [Pseudomonadota bacterium]